MSGSYLQGAKYLIEAGGFRHSINILLANLETDQRGMPKYETWQPMYLLASHAAELYLKSALLKRAHPEQDLRTLGTRHNLIALADLLGACVAISTSTRTTLGHLSEQHRRHLLRYGIPEGEAAYIPHPQAVLDMLDELLNHCKVSGT